MSAFLPQAEADLLLAMEKHRANDDLVRLPDIGGGLIVPIVSADGLENFHLDIARGRINLAKGKFQARARTTLVIARVDIGGPPHRNPDDNEIPCPHIHLYREGYGDRWAFPLAASDFSDASNHWTTLIEFIKYCNISRPPNFDRGLFT